MSSHVDALRRNLANRLALCNEDEVRLMDWLLLRLEQARETKAEAPLYSLDEGSELERAYRRGWNDAMRSESAEATLWRTRLLMTTRELEVEQRLAELRAREESE